MSNHDQLAKQAERVRNNLRDLLDQPDHSQARSVRQHVEALISELKQKKSRETIDSRLKTLISNLERVEEEVMDFRHSNQLKGLCEDMRRETQKL